ncbi:MAG: Crp/Fnr family transcriptional regulator [Christensenellaceae bacterium]|nr:Crp/Fnr family transcriptional regulator [Christensenellaceae bacterium]
MDAKMLFSGLTNEELAQAHRFFHAEIVHYEKGDFIQRQGEPMRFFGMVISGCVQVFMDDIDGNQMMMANVQEGEFFGESLCYLATKETPVYIRAAEDVEMMKLRTEGLYQKFPENEALAQLLRERFTAMLARRALAMNDRIQILSKSSLRGKLITFFSQCEIKYGSKSFRIPFDRAGLAVYLGTNRSALSRELSTMQKDGIIEFSHDQFHILK